MHRYIGLSVSLLLGFLLIGLPYAQAQEIYCNVRVQSQGAENQDKQVFEQMQKSIQDFMNLRRRTADQIGTEERIAMNIIINITSSPRIGFFSATAQIQAIRPVFGASFETPILNFLDKEWDFEYTNGMPMDFNDNSLQYTNSLTALLSFYSYLVMAMDYDTFSKMGGKNYYQKAQYIATNAGAVDPSKGWSQFGGTNTRFSLISNMQDPLVQPFREALYDYHRKGLDEFAEKPEEARANILVALGKLKTVQEAKPLNIALNTYLDTKGIELVNIFSQATSQEKQAAYNILVQMDPTKSEKYQALIK